MDTDPLSTERAVERCMDLAQLAVDYPHLEIPEPASAFMVHPALRTVNTCKEKSEEEKKTDSDRDPESRRYRTMEAAANRLQKESKGYLDSLRGTCLWIDPRSSVDFYSHDRLSDAHCRDNRRFLR